MSRRKKILMLTTQLGYGGAETSFIRLANFLAQTMDVTVALFTSNYGVGAYSAGHEALAPSIVLLDGVSPCGRVRRWWRRWVLLRALKRDHDVTISFLSGPNLLNVLAGYNTRSIVSLRGSRWFDPVSGRFQKWLFWFFLDPLVVRLAAYIVPISPGLVNEITRAGGRRAAAKAMVIPPFVVPDLLQRDLAELPAEPYALLKGQPVIVGVGRLSVEKGFHHLIRVFCALATQHSGVKLLLVGDGPAMTALRAQCVQAGMVMDDLTPGISAVIFAGYQKNPLPLIALGRVFAMTSATEGFSNVVLEALAAGVPVVAADTPWGVRSILWDAPKTNDVPYPTLQPTQADYGTLMPRIDLLEYQDMWGHILGLHVMSAPALPPVISSRVNDFDILKIGQKWLTLIEKVTGE